MIARQLITDEIMHLKTSDTGKTALSWMDEYKVSHLPIVNNEDFLGLIAEQDIYSFNNLTEPLGNHTLSLKNPFVNEHEHVYNVLKLIDELKLTVIPVLDDHNKYLGCITISRLVNFLSGTYSIANPGGIIVLEMSEKDYSLTELSNIVESNNAKVLSLFLSSHVDSTKLEVVIKVNRIDMGSILQTFDRYGYYVKATYGEDEDTGDLKDRYDSFMNYLNM
ncbi:MAG: CBS domain-containing protein [bacterium]